MSRLDDLANERGFAFSDPAQHEERSPASSPFQQLQHPPGALSDPRRHERPSSTWNARGKRFHLIVVFEIHAQAVNRSAALPLGHSERRSRPFGSDVAVIMLRRKGAESGGCVQLRTPVEIVKRRLVTESMDCLHLETRRPMVHRGAFSNHGYGSKRCSLSWLIVPSHCESPVTRRKTVGYNLPSP